MRYTEKYKLSSTHGSHLSVEPRLHQATVHGHQGQVQTIDITRLLHGPLWADCLAKTEWTSGHPSKSHPFKVMKCNVLCYVMLYVMSSVYVLCNLYIIDVTHFSTTHDSWRCLFVQIYIACSYMLRFVICTLCSVILCSFTSIFWPR
jgi:hypothetical protein